VDCSAGHHRLAGRLRTILSSLLRDRDQVYGEPFRHRVKGMRITEVLTASRSPWQNPFAERLIGSVRRECLDHRVPRMPTEKGGGVSLTLALLRNVGTCRPDAKGTPQGSGPAERGGTEAGHGGGVPRSSEEADESRWSEGGASTGTGRWPTVQQEEPVNGARPFVSVRPTAG